MLFQNVKIQPITARDGEISAFPSQHLLFSVRGSAGKLCLCWYKQPIEKPPYEEYRGAVVLNKVPLIRIQSSGCPTCESLLAAGGFEQERRGEIEEALSKLRSGYHGMEDALERLRPVIGLLRPGIYALTESEYCPTDGDGRFFWDVPENFTPYQATAELYDSATFRVLPSFPCYLYPSQPSGKYDPERVDHYRQMLRSGKKLPPVLAYSVWGYMSVLLDGHHRACACALEGVEVPCLTISQPGRIWREGVDYLVWPDGGETPVEALSFSQQKLWDSAKPQAEEIPPPEVSIEETVRPFFSEYAEAVAHYPTVWEAGVLALYPKLAPSVKSVWLLALDEDYEDRASAASLLHFLARQPGADVKQLGFTFAGRDAPYELRLAAFKLLDAIKEDPQIDDLMVQMLVDCETKDDPIRCIADKHWD